MRFEWPEFEVHLETRLTPADREAFNEVVRRHESLRTCFPLIGDRPVQRVVPPRPMPIVPIDLRGLRPEDRRTESARHRDATILDAFATL